MVRRERAIKNHASFYRKIIAAISVASVGTGGITISRAVQDTPTDVGPFITFDIPGAANGTFPTSINQAGAITGYYNDANFVGHGFLRIPGRYDKKNDARDGTFVTFDISGAVNGTYPASINPSGAITGSYVDANFVGHGFLRTTGGTVDTFDVPGAATIGTVPSSINPTGIITGYYYDANFVGHGFLRARDGTVITFDVPGAGSGHNQGTAPLGITPAGIIMGLYIDAQGGHHGFLLNQ
jgi:hypothetical protein